MTEHLDSWGRFPQENHSVRHIAWRDNVECLFAAPGDFLAYGNGRSYGDCCLNAGGTLIRTAWLKRFISFDVETGLLRAEAGVTLGEINALTVPRGWFLYVTPGTQHVTLGGAIANDVHGKNHHRHGTFGHHVKRLELVRTDRQRIVCSSTDGEEWFKATIGGLGLTGLMTWAEIQLRRVTTAMLEVDTQPFFSIEEFLTQSVQADLEYEYSVAWFQCTRLTPRPEVRGLFFKANHLDRVSKVMRASDCSSRPKVSIPFNFPRGLINRFTSKAFNSLYFHSGNAGKRRSLVPLSRFFYPLDAVGNWNRVFGRDGFLQHQCVVPASRARDALEALLRETKGTPFTLGVLKFFGSHSAAGYMSFPRAGLTVAMDFIHDGEPSLDLFSRLNDVVAQVSGALYPAKDATMSAPLFRSSFPNWRQFSQFIDPKFSSSFWRRVGVKD